MYWKGGWQELVQFSFQHFGTDKKGIFNKNLWKYLYSWANENFSIKYLGFSPLINLYCNPRYMFSAWVKIACFEFFLSSLTALGAHLFKDGYSRTDEKVEN